jgi:hypothetical protein
VPKYSKRVNLRKFSPFDFFITTAIVIVAVLCCCCYYCGLSKELIRRKYFILLWRKEAERKNERVVVNVESFACAAIDKFLSLI